MAQKHPIGLQAFSEVVNTGCDHVGKAGHHSDRYPNDPRQTVKAAVAPRCSRHRPAADCGPTKRKPTP